MQIGELELLRILLEEKSVTRTAIKTHLSQPAITMRLQKLREKFKDPLLLREGNTMLLTKKAQSMIEPLKRITHDLALITPQKSFDPKTNPTKIKLVINEFYSTIDNCVENIIHDIQLANKNHQISICISPLKTAHDGAFITLPDADLIIGNLGPIDEYESEWLEDHEMVLAFDQYSLPDKSLTLESYCKLPHIVFSFDDDTNFFLDIISHPDPRNVKLRVINFQLGKRLLTDQYVITTSKRVALLNQLKYVKLPFDMSPLAVHLSYPSALKHDPKNIWLRKLVLKHIRLSPSGDNTSDMG